MFNLRLFARLISAKELNENGVTTMSTASEAIVEILHVMFKFYLTQN